MIQCPIEDGGGICPDKAKCCKIDNDDGTFTSGCIPYSKLLPGERTCCNDDSFLSAGFASGCAGDYECASSTLANGEVDFMCTKDQKDSNGNVERVSTLPRYHMVPSSKEQMTMYGYPLVRYTNGEVNSDTPTIAYFSNMDWVRGDYEIDQRIQQVVFVVHGSGRNADDYLYAGMAAAKSQKTYPVENILIIAPRFLVDEDEIDQIPVKNGSNITVLMKPLLWNEREPIAHTWRYGANALAPFEDVSSYDVMDHLVEHFAFNAGFGNRYSSLERIAVIGHSAGGQFSQRWSLTSNSGAWQDFKLGSYVSSLRNARGELALDSGLSIRAVVANPRSYCYMDERRIIKGRLKVPPLPMIRKCPTYNTWEWGLQNGGILPTPYKDKAIDFFDGDTDKLAHRYAQRKIFYLSGENDTQTLHGSCEDDGFQGKYRRQRSMYFYRSLRDYFGRKVHSRSVIKHVGHDHSLIFGSKEGLSSIFEE